MPGCFVFTTVHSQILFFLTYKGFQLIQLGCFGNLVILNRDRCSCLAHPVEHTIMVDAGNALDRSKSHTVERHSDAKGFDLCTVAQLGIVLKLGTASEAQVALLAIAMPIFDNFVTVAVRTVHGYLPRLYIIPYYATPQIAPSRALLALCLASASRPM